MRKLRSLVLLGVYALANADVARAQGPALASADAGADAAVAPSLGPLVAPPLTSAERAEKEKAKERPAPGPAVYDRRAGRRRGNPATGGLLVAVAVGALLYYAVKRIRR